MQRTFAAFRNNISEAPVYPLRSLEDYVEVYDEVEETAVILNRDHSTDECDPKVDSEGPSLVVHNHCAEYAGLTIGIGCIDNEERILRDQWNFTKSVGFSAVKLCFSVLCRLSRVAHKQERQQTIQTDLHHKRAPVSITSAEATCMYQYAYACSLVWESDLAPWVEWCFQYLVEECIGTKESYISHNGSFVPVDRLPIYLLSLGGYLSVLLPDFDSSSLEIIADKIVLQFPIVTVDHLQGRGDFWWSDSFLQLLLTLHYSHCYIDVMQSSLSDSDTPRPGVYLQSVAQLVELITERVLASVAYCIDEVLGAIHGTPSQRIEDTRVLLQWTSVWEIIVPFIYYMTMFGEEPNLCDGKLQGSQTVEGENQLSNFGAAEINTRYYKFLEGLAPAFLQKKFSSDVPDILKLSNLRQSSIAALLDVAIKRAGGKVTFDNANEHFDSVWKLNSYSKSRYILSRISHSASCQCYNVDICASTLQKDDASLRTCQHCDEYNKVIDEAISCIDNIRNSGTGQDVADVVSDWLDIIEILWFPYKIYLHFSTTWTAPWQYGCCSAPSKAPCKSCCRGVCIVGPFHVLMKMERYLLELFDDTHANTGSAEEMLKKMNDILDALHYNASK